MLAWNLITKRRQREANVKCFLSSFFTLSTVLLYLLATITPILCENQPTARFGQAMLLCLSLLAKNDNQRDGIDRRIRDSGQPDKIQPQGNTRNLDARSKERRLLSVLTPENNRAFDTIPNTI